MGTKERSAALTAQAEAALDAVLARLDISLSDDDARHVARQMWFDGYGAGMDTVKAFADAAFARIRADV